jgi:hypothetical protein
MERCERCAPAESGGAFCAVCGAFLGWEQTEEVSPPDRPAAPARSVRPSTADPGANAPVGPRVAGADRAAPPATERPGDRTNAEAAAATGTTAATETTPEVASAVQPARPRARRPAVRQRPSGTDDAAGGVVCPVCATGNPPDRRFCRRCGAALGAHAGPTVRVPWWRRALLRAARWLVRPRSGARGVLHRFGVLLLAAALLAGLGYGAVRLGSRASEAVRDTVADPQPVSPISVRASSQARNHPPGLVADGLSNSYWAPAAAGAGRGEYVEFTFAGPFRLRNLIIHPGVSAQRAVFLRQARPAVLELAVWTSRHGPETTTIRLADQAGPQAFHRVVGDVLRIRLTVRESYGSTAGRRTALSEVEFFRRP